MALEEYNRQLETCRQKYALGRELVDVVTQDSTPKEFRDMCTAVGKMAKKIEEVETLKQQLKQKVLERRREIKEEMRSAFVEATGCDRDPDVTVVQGEIESVGRQVREKEKNCSKLIKEKKMLDHDRLYHKVFQGIAPIHFDKTSTESHVKGYITKKNGELYAFEFDLDKEDSCTVADTLWDNL